MNQEDTNLTTIHALASETRTRCLRDITEAAFAKECLKFEDNIILDGCDEEGDLNEDDDLTRQAIGLMKMLALDGGKLDAKFWQLAMVWLDGRGYGDWMVGQLGLRLAELRNEMEKKSE